MKKHRPRYATDLPSGEWHRWWMDFGRQPLRDLMLLYWDPIGVYGVSEARDEYERYTNKVGAMLGNGSSAKDIAQYLRDVAVDAMGISAPTSADAARRIVEWFDDSMRAYANEVKLRQSLVD